MNIGVLSGKGGTGKTTVSTNLAKVLKANYIDCDVEEPNGFIFLKPEIVKKEDVRVIYPVIEDEKCIMCGKCAEICQFNALAKTKKDILLFEKLCHGCGACQIVCPNGAITFEERAIGVIEEGKSEDITSMRGILNIGEPMVVPVIKKLLNSIKGKINIVDCSPGTSCNVVNILQHVDTAVLVTETTEFALHDLKLAVELVRNFNIPFGVIINKDMEEDNIIRDYCSKEGIKVLGSIPYSREIAEVYSKGDMLVSEEKYKLIFDSIAEEIKNEQVTEEIKSFCRKENYEVVGEIPYDDTVMKAINELKPITEYKESKVNLEIIKMWEKIKKILYKKEEEL